MTVKPLNFGPVIHATFLERPNRFLVRCRLENGRTVEAFMPNPGRMGELLLPGVRLHLVDNGKGTLRKTRFTCLAVDREGASVFLHTHVNNAVAEYLLRAGRIPGLERAEVVRSEVRVGHSRFDFLLREGGRDVLAEVMSV
ncbi:MAG: DNA/RNA nuclease SfsA, partial [Candidatus Hydrogenedentes bacterium]|nr:DNA/RNA nuclease SfsA [Candidatus Hydrogenedentota bacterium]